MLKASLLLFSFALFTLVLARIQRPAALIAHTHTRAPASEKGREFPRWIRHPNQPLQVAFAEDQIATLRGTKRRSQFEVKFSLTQNQCEENLPNGTELLVRGTRDALQLNLVWETHPTRPRGSAVPRTLSVELFHGPLAALENSNQWIRDEVSFSYNGESISPPLTDGKFRVERVSTVQIQQNAFLLSPEVAYNSNREFLGLTFTPQRSAHDHSFVLTNLETLLQDGSGQAASPWLLPPSTNTELVFWVEKTLGPTRTLCTLIWTKVTQQPEVHQADAEPTSEIQAIPTGLWPNESVLWELARPRTQQPSEEFQ